MSWRERDDRWSDGRRSAVGGWHDAHDERQRSPLRRDRYEREERIERGERYEREDRTERGDRYEREERVERQQERRYDRPRPDRHRSRRRSPSRYSSTPPPPSPPNISAKCDDECERRTEAGVEYEEMSGPVHASPGDWFCQCGSYNFKRRLYCYRRNCNGKRADGTPYGGKDVPEANTNVAGITKRILFRRLDALTTEEKILDTLKERCSKKVVDSIVGISVGREALTGASKCLAYIDFNNVTESAQALTELQALCPCLTIDSRDVLISYYNEPTKYQKHNYHQYYSNSTYSQSDRVNAAAAVAHCAIAAAHARHNGQTPLNPPTGDATTKYPPPDVRTFQYDETSGYYYDPATGLYYDATTQYFYNNQINEYMYWNATTTTYVKADRGEQKPTAEKPQLAPATVGTAEKPPEEKKKRDKEDKVKVAKKIAKDMERWARTLNQKKENARNNYVMEQPTDASASVGSADIGFSVLGEGTSLSTHVRDTSPTVDIVRRAPLSPAPVSPATAADDDIIDWSKLSCLLCKRKFPSAEVLTKHMTMSELHKQNLAEHEQRQLPQSNGYRDRAAERRLKFGEGSPPPRRRYEEPITATPAVAAGVSAAGDVADTIGGQMLQKMGWQRGKGLGRAEQGRTAPITAEARPALAGLGQKRSIYTPTPGETYRDTVKKLMIARYKEVVGQEEEQ